MTSILGIQSSSSDIKEFEESDTEEVDVKETTTPIYAIVECRLKKELVHPRIIQSQSLKIHYLLQWIEGGWSQLEVEPKEKKAQVVEVEQKWDFLSILNN